MPTLLEDFTTKELMFLSLVLEDKAIDLRNSIELIRGFSDSETKNDLLKSFADKLDMTEQWITKIFEAHVEVKKKEIIQSN